MGEVPLYPLHPTPYTLHPTPYTPNPTPYTQRSTTHILHGYHTHKKTEFPRTLPYDHAWGPMMVLGGMKFSYPVGPSDRSTVGSLWGTVL
jgi:hypothetical protein